MWRVARFLAVVLGILGGIYVYTVVRGDHSPDRSRTPQVFGMCDVHDSAVDLSIRGWGADEFCRSWVKQEGTLGEFWHMTDVTANAGPSIKQACSLVNGALTITVFQAVSDFGTPGNEICASLVGQGWTEQQ